MQTHSYFGNLPSGPRARPARFEVSHQTIWVMSSTGTSTHRCGVDKVRVYKPCFLICCDTAMTKDFLSSRNSSDSSISYYPPTDSRIKSTIADLVAHYGSSSATAWLEFERYKIWRPSRPIAESDFLPVQGYMREGETGIRIYPESPKPFLIHRPIHLRMG